MNRTIILFFGLVFMISTTHAEGLPRPPVQEWFKIYDCWNTTQGYSLFRVLLLEHKKSGAVKAHFAVSRDLVEDPLQSIDIPITTTGSSDEALAYIGKDFGIRVERTINPATGQHDGTLNATQFGENYQALPLDCE